MFCSLENLSLIKLEEDKNKEESSKIKEFMETYETNVENVLGMVADDIISYYNSKLSEEEGYYRKELHTIVEQNSPLGGTQSIYESVFPNIPSDRNIVSAKLKLVSSESSLIDANRPTSSLHDISAQGYLTQGKNLRNQNRISVS